MKHAALLAGLVGAVGLAGPALAEDGETLSDVVVSAAPFPISLDTATTHVEILGRAELEATAPAGLGDTLAAIPGLRSSAYAPGASRPIIRGQSGARVQVLQNGVGLIDASALSPDHAVASDPIGASRIEVLRGPSALAYGGSGVGGVVNVIDDRVPRNAPDDGLAGRYAASWGGPGEGRALAARALIGKGPLVLALDGDYRTSEAYKVAATPVSDALAARDGLTPDLFRTVRNTEMELRTLGAGIAHIDDLGSFGLAYRRTTTRYGIPYPQILAPIDPLAEGPVMIDLAQDRIDLRGERAIDFGPFDMVRLTAGWADYQHAEREAATGAVGTRFLSEGFETRLELTQKEAGGHKGAFGLQALSRDLRAIGAEAFVPPSRIEEIGLFSLQRLEFADWGLDAGLRLDRRSLAAALAGRPASTPAATAGVDWSLANSRQTFSGLSASAGAFLRPAEGRFYSLSLSRNVRSPSESELFADGPHPGTAAFELGDPTLDPETAWSLEAMGRWTLGSLKVEAHAFAARYQGFIDQRPTGAIEDGLAVYRFVQTDAGFYGGELEASHELWRGPAGSLELEAGFDWMRGETDLGPPARMPPYAASLRLNWAGQSLDATLEVRHVGAQDRLTVFETETKAYTLVGASAAWRPRGADGPRIFLEGRNLTDREAREHVSFLKDIAPLPGRSVRLGIAGGF